MMSVHLHMSQKRFVNIIVMSLVLAIISVLGYFVLVKKSAVQNKIQTPTSMSNTTITPTPFSHTSSKGITPQGECPVGQPDCIDYLINGAPPDGSKTISPLEAPAPQAQTP